MSAPVRDRDLAAAYTLPDAPAGPGGGEPPAVPGEVPGDSTPTFELEMLVSGAVLVGLVQLLGVSDGWVHAARAVDASSRVVFMLMAVVAKAVLYALSATFVVHIVVRAYWVGLIGLQSVFPGGPRWERLRTAGPYSRAELARTTPPLRDIAAQVDNVASTLFSAGFLLALLTAYSVAVNIPALGAGVLVERITGGRVGLTSAYAAVLAVVMIVANGPVLVDQRSGIGSGGPQLRVDS